MSLSTSTKVLRPMPAYQCWFFRVKPIARLIFKAQNFPEAAQFPTNPYYYFFKAQNFPEAVQFPTNPYY